MLMCIKYMVPDNYNRVNNMDARDEKKTYHHEERRQLRLEVFHRRLALHIQN